MGLLSEGSELSWQETKSYDDHVRKHGIAQFINLYRKLRDRQNDCLKWGDEIEYMIVKFNHSARSAAVCLKAKEILPILQLKEKNKSGDTKALWRPEYSSYMIEGTPGEPYGSLTSHFNTVEANMKIRREEVEALLKPDECLFCLTSFPRLGCGKFTFPPYDPTPESGASRSLFFPDEAIYDALPRFVCVTKNSRERRGKKVIINAPIYRDKNTPSPFVEDFSHLGDDGQAREAALPDHVYMDCMGFGMGCACLQVTFQACNINEARLLYDQLAPVCPIAMALSAASPIHRGFLTDVDCRWNIVAAASDERTDEEMGIKPLKHDRFVINKSRYGSIDSYISPRGEKYNDIKLVHDKEIYDQLKAAGIDHLLAQHFAHLFIRDPLTLLRERIHQNDEQDTDHFENIQSTNWQTMRFKPPPSNSNIGWRVEFRTMEVQQTEFENAAYVVFIVLLTRVILTYPVDFLIPISKVDENMQEAQKRDAVLNGKFWFRQDIMAAESAQNGTDESGCDEYSCGKYVKMTINDIINGKKDVFPGLVPLIRKFLTSMDVDVDTQCTIQQYLELISKRASGELMTTARWIRDFVAHHPEYKHDSVVGEGINYDLLTRIHDIVMGKEKCSELLGHPSTRTQDKIPDAVKKAEDSYRAIALDKIR